MADYAAAYNQGIQASRAGETARQGIDEVFRELNDQLRAEGVEGLEIKRKRVASPDPFETPALSAFRYALGYKKPTHMAIVVELSLIHI